MARKKHGLKAAKKRLDAMYKATPAQKGLYKASSSQKGLMKALWGTSKKKMHKLL
jgi:hypothetical protein